MYPRTFVVAMDTRVEFRSTAFPKYLNEDDEIVNVNGWGKRLAEFLRDTLPTYGVATGKIHCEDWGWLVTVPSDEFSLWIGCGPMDDATSLDVQFSFPASSASDSDATMTDFCLFVQAELSWFKKLFRQIDATPTVSRVVGALHEMVTDHDEFQDVVWGE